MNYIIYHIL